MGSAGNLERASFPQVQGQGWAGFMSRRRIYLQVLLLYISLRVEFSKTSRTTADVRLLGQFNINDSIEKILCTCHLC
jgi:hypothetical protein